MDSLPLRVRRVVALVAVLLAPPLHFTPLLAVEPVRRSTTESVEQDRQCLSCHDEMEARSILSIYQTRHGVKGDARTPTCQSCHGDSLAHGKKDKVIGKRPLTDIPFSPAPATALLDAESAEMRSAPCLQCHASNVARQWAGSNHESRGLACTSCHTLHTPRDRLLEPVTEAETCLRCHPTIRAETRRPSAHPLATGKLACSSCHAAHGGEGAHLLWFSAVNDNCYECHTDKRGPFLWEHAPVTDNCLSCHTPHGSAHAPLLKARQPWLCQQCHSSYRHPSTAFSGAQIPGGAGTLAAQIPSHGCANCHARVHGSNHPSGARLLR
jgi:DmsE family decaheme c-type cytochrome